MKKIGFTLSEVLLTLVIIGVIAALTVPGFLNHTNSMEFRSALKKAVSTVNQAMALHYALTGLSAQDYSSEEDIVSNLFKKRLHIIDGEKEFTSEVCDGALFTVDDGMIFCVTNFSSDNADPIDSICNMRNTTPCIQSEGPNLWIDVNGVKNPNSVTTAASRPKDIYQAQIYSQKVVPYGVPTQEILYGIETRNNIDNNTNGNPTGDGDNTGGDTGDGNDSHDKPTVEPDNPNPDPPYNPDYEDEPWWKDFLDWLNNLLHGLMNITKELIDTFLGLIGK